MTQLIDHLKNGLKEDLQMPFNPGGHVETSDLGMDLGMGMGW